MSYPEDYTEPLRSSLIEEGVIKLTVRLEDSSTSTDYNLTHDFTVRELVLTASSVDQVWKRFHEMVDELENHVKERIKKQRIIYDRKGVAESVKHQIVKVGRDRG